MLVVLDSNIFISALISPRGHSGKIYQAWTNKRFGVVSCQEQIEELRRASRYPRIQPVIQPRLFGSLLNRLSDVCTVQKIERLHTADDVNDSYLLDLADTAGADYLVTGEKRSGLLKRRRVGRASIFTAATFCEEVLHV
jgi:uncharacterized protein